MSEEITPRMPQDDRINRLFNLVQTLVDDMQSVKADLQEVKAEFGAPKLDTKPMLEEIRNTVASISVDVAELKKEAAKMSRSHMSVVQLLGDLAGRASDLDVDEWDKQIEEKK